MDIIENIRSELREELEEIYVRQDSLVSDLYNLDTKDGFNSYRITKELKYIDNYSKIIRTCMANTYLVKDFTDEKLIKDIKNIFNLYYEALDVLDEALKEILLAYNKIFLKELIDCCKDKTFNRKLLERIYIILNYNILPTYGLEFEKKKDFVKHSTNIYSLISYLSILNIEEDEYELKSEELVAKYLQDLKFYILNGESKELESFLEVKKYILSNIVLLLKTSNDILVLEENIFSDIFLKLIKEIVIDMGNKNLYEDLNALYSIYIKLFFDVISSSEDRRRNLFLASIETIYFLEALNLIEEDEYPIYTLEDFKLLNAQNTSDLKQITKLELEYDKLLDKRRKSSIKIIDGDNRPSSIDSNVSTINIQIARIKKNIRKLYLQI